MKKAREFSKNYLESCAKFHEKYGVADVSFEYDEDRLYVYIYTERLYLKSVGIKDVESYDKFLFGDPEVMKTMSSGNKWSKEQITERLGLWEVRWKTGSPFAALKVSLQEKDGIIGNVCMGSSEEKFSSELSYIIAKSLWGKGYATEAVGSVLFDYAQRIVESDKNHSVPAQGEFQRIIATALEQNNPASNKILENMDFTLYKTAEKFGAMRNFYELNIVEKYEVQNIGNIQEHN